MASRQRQDRHRQAERPAASPARIGLRDSEEERLTRVPGCEVWVRFDADLALSCGAMLAVTRMRRAVTIAGSACRRSTMPPAAQGGQRPEALAIVAGGVPTRTH